MWILANELESVEDVSFMSLIMKSNLCMHPRKLAMLHIIFMIFLPHAMDVTKDGRTTCSRQETCRPVYLFYTRECFCELYYSECLSVDLIFGGKLEETAVYSPSYWSESGLIHRRL